MATTHDATSLGAYVGQGAPYGTGVFTILKFHVDMSSLASDLAATIDGSSSDVVQLWDIPVGTQILGVLLNVTTKEGATATMAVGDGDSTAGYLAATSINSTGYTGTITTDAYGAATKVYAATDTLDLLFATDSDIDTAVFDLYVYALMNPAVYTIS